ncbi:MAG: hypothetical protein Kapaf2KO_11540 [Candidatus Kapaibacteriales bacterium]
MAKRNKDLSNSLEELLQACRRKIRVCDERLITKAFRYCLKMHKGQNRLSGEPFHNHPIASAFIVANEIKLDDISVASALLSHVVRKSNVTIQEIREEFGETISVIVEGLDRISRMETKRSDKIGQLDNYRKILLSLFKDFRIILVKLGLRLNNMRTIGYLPEETQREIATETMEVYTPYANRFGLRNLKWELEDLSFKVLDPDNYHTIRKKLKTTRAEREKYVKDFIKPIKKILEKDPRFADLGIKFRIDGRAKHIYSIHNKTIARQKPMEELYDLEGFRIIIDSDDPLMCFYFYGAAASIYPPVPETFKDYISAPKKNGYQSIHTGLIGPEQRLVELQIRTEQMHTVSEIGVAAHFDYKKGLLPASSVLDSEEATEWLDSIREIFDSEQSESPQTLLTSVKQNVFLEEIHVLTPKNELRTFPAGATALDFAYSIHMELGDMAIGAKINGDIMPLDTKLNSGDSIEIITSKNAKPSREWLTMAITPKAKSGIRKFLRRQKKEAMSLGLDIISDIFQKHKIRLRTREFAKLLNSMGFNKRDELYLALGKGEIKPSRVLAVLINNQAIGTAEGLENSLQISSDLNPKEGKENEEKDIIAEFNLMAGFRDNVLEDIGGRIVNVEGLIIESISYSNEDDKVFVDLKVRLQAPERLDFLLRELHSTRGMLSVKSKE